MKLYVCFGTFPTGPYTHSCGAAHEALEAAGHDHEVVKAYAFGGFPGALQTGTRKKVKEQTGEYWVPALELDDGSWIAGSKKIVAWAEANPATTTPSPAPTA